MTSFSTKTIKKTISMKTNMNGIFLLIITYNLENKIIFNILLFAKTNIFSKLKFTNFCNIVYIQNKRLTTN